MTHPIWPLFHRLWTKAVGEPDYVKQEWRELETAILMLSTDEALRHAGAAPAPPPSPASTKCKNVDCPADAIASFVWPGSVGGAYCLDHTFHARRIAEALGFELVVQPIGGAPWSPPAAAAAPAQPRAPLDVAKLCASNRALAEALIEEVDRGESSLSPRLAFLFGMVTAALPGGRQP